MYFVESGLFDFDSSFYGFFDTAQLTIVSILFSDIHSIILSKLCKSQDSLLNLKSTKSTCEPTKPLEPNKPIINIYLPPIYLPNK